MVRVSFFLLWVGLLALTACNRSPEAQARGATAAASTTTQQVFQVKGVVLGVKPAEKSVEIKHEAIPGYMPAMTMPFDVKDTNLLTGLKAGDSVSFQLRVTDTEGWIDHIQKLGSGPTNSPPTTGPFRLVRDVEPLNVGDPLPNYQFTNQFGQPVSTAQFKGQALAITFLFTRCPFPTFCPLMANHFAEAQQKLLARPNAPTNWHLLTISFDPDFDKPAVLKSYAEQHHYDPAHWTFATGALIDVTAIGEQVGLTFWHDETGSISHNLRTVVVDASGRLRKTFVGNQWSSDELVEELVKAAK
jgi:protein SCO1